MSSGPMTRALGEIRKILDRETTRDEPDQSLLQRFVAGRDPAAFAALLERHGPLVLGVCRRLLRHEQDAEDAFQAVFLVLTRNARAIRRQQSVSSWLYGVALRVSVKARTRSARHPVGELGEDQETPCHEPDPAVVAETKELRAVLDEELHRLPRQERDLLVLCDLQGLSHQDVARQLNLPSGSVSRRLAKARDRLRDRLAWRGVVVTAGLLTSVLTAEEVRAAIPTALASITIQGPMKVLAGQAVSGAFAAPIVALAQSMLRDVFMTKIKVTIALLIAVGLLGGMTGAIWYQTATAGDKPGPVAKADAAPDGQAPAVKANRPSAKHQEKLNQQIDIEAYDQVPLGDLLEFLSEKYMVPIYLNVEAFSINQVDVANVMIKLPKLKGVKLSQVLNRVLTQVTGAYLVRSDGIEVTTAQHAMPGEWEQMRRTNLPTATTRLDKKPLEEVLEDLAEATGINIVIDPATGDKAKQPLTANLKNVPLDTAVRLLADMADLKVIMADNVLYITTKEKASQPNLLGPKPLGPPGQ